MTTSIIERLAAKAAAAKANATASRQEARLLDKTNDREEKVAEIDRQAAALRAQMERECPRHFNPDRQRREESAPFVSGETFPPAKIDVEAALRAWLRLTFAEERRRYLADRVREISATAEPLKAELHKLRAELAEVQAELSAG